MRYIYRLRRFERNATRVIRFVKSKTIFFIIVALIWFFVLKKTDELTDDIFKQSFWGSVLVEAHGFFMDIILFGIIVTFYESLTERRNEIERLKEEIDDYRHWNEPEAMYRIVGCIKRLNKQGVTIINLKFCFLEGAYLANLDLNGADLRHTNLRGSNLRVTNLQGAYLRRADLQNAKLGGTHLQGADLRGVNLKNTNLREVNLQGANLEGANLEGANLENADLQKASLNETNLQGANLVGVKIENLAELKIINKNSKKEHKALLVGIGREKCYVILDFL